MAQTDYRPHLSLVYGIVAFSLLASRFRSLFRVGVQGSRVEGRGSGGSRGSRPRDAGTTGGTGLARPFSLIADGY